MVYALKCIKNGVPFTAGEPPKLHKTVSDAVHKVLHTRKDDQTEAWKNAIQTFKYDMPPKYDPNLWVKEYKDCHSTNLDYFNQAAKEHHDLVQQTLSGHSLFFDQCPTSGLTIVKFKNKTFQRGGKPNQYIGEGKSRFPEHPPVKATGRKFKIITHTGVPTIQSGHVVEIRVSDDNERPGYLTGQTARGYKLSVYYQGVDYCCDKERWEIVKAKGAGTIRHGDTVLIKNRYVAAKSSYLCPHKKLGARAAFLKLAAKNAKNHPYWIIEFDNPFYPP
jgi:hypothetical protein